jgi:hypothetical protein
VVPFDPIFDCYNYLFNLIVVFSTTEAAGERVVLNSSVTGAGGNAASARSG